MTNHTPLTTPRERFIPISRHEIAKDLLAAPHWHPEERNRFEEFCTIFNALYHFKFHSHLEELKRSYFPFNPDTDLVTKHDYSLEELQALQLQLVEETRGLLNHANYEEMTTADLNTALTAESFYAINVYVDLEDFADMLIFYRGASTKTHYVRRWISLFLHKHPLEVPIYKRLFLLVKFKTTADRAQELAQAMMTTDDELSLAKATKKATKKVNKARQDLPVQVENKVFLKMFKDIPRSDLDTLFPNQEVRLRLFDKIKLAVTGGGGAIGGIVGILGKIATAAIHPFALIGAFLGLIGVIVRQIMSIFHHRTKYMMVLSRTLYFHTLDNNFGVINSLIDEAEEEEGKEAILAYYFLHVNAKNNYTQDSLDHEIENYIQQKYGVAIDFEVGDGLRKLRQEGLLKEQAGGILKVLPLNEAGEILDKQWDNFFQYNQEKGN
jgi:hypothetical protein